MKRIHCFILFISIALFTACPKESEDNFVEGYLTGNITAPQEEVQAGDNTRTYGGTVTPGDMVEFEVYDLPAPVGTRTKGWVMANLTTGSEIVISGDAEVLPTGFLKIYVTDSTNTTVVPIGGAGYAFEVPGVLLMVFAMNSTMQPSILISTGDCGTVGNSEYNMIFAAYPDGNGTAPKMDSTAYVDFTITPVSSYEFSVPSGTAHYLNNTSPFSPTETVTAVPEGSFICYGGRIFDRNTSGVDRISGFVSSSGALVLDNGPGNGGLMGFKKGSVPTADDLKKEHYGFVVTHDLLATTIGAGFGGVIYSDCRSGTCSGGLVSNIETGELDTAPGSTFSNQPLAQYDATTGRYAGTQELTVNNSPVTINSVGMGYKWNGKTVQVGASVFAPGQVMNTLTVSK